MLLFTGRENSIFLSIVILKIFAEKSKRNPHIFVINGSQIFKKNLWEARNLN